MKMSQKFREKVGHQFLGMYNYNDAVQKMKSDRLVKEILPGIQS